METFEPVPQGNIRRLIKNAFGPDEFGNPGKEFTGRIVLKNDSTQINGFVYYQRGKVYAVHYDGFQPPVVRRLFAAGVLSKEQAEQYLAVPNESIEGQLVADNVVDKATLDDINHNMVLSSLLHIYDWGSHTTWREEDGIVVTNFTISPLEPSLLVAATNEREGQWAAVQRAYPEVANRAAIPHLTNSNISDIEDPVYASVLKNVNGANTVGKLASLTGLTRFELAGRLAKAVADNVVEFPSVNTAIESLSAEQQGELARFHEERVRLMRELQLVNAEIARLEGGEGFWNES